MTNGWQQQKASIVGVIETSANLPQRRNLHNHYKANQQIIINNWFLQDFINK